MHNTNVSTLARQETRGRTKQWPLPSSRRNHYAAPLLSALGRHLLISAPLLFADWLAATSAFLVAVQMTMIIWPAAVIDLPSLAVSFLTGIVFANLAVGLYPGFGIGSIGELRLSGAASLLIAVVFCLTSFANNRIDLPVQFSIVMSCVLFFFLLPCARGMARALVGHFQWWGEPVLIVGPPGSAGLLYGFLRRNSAWGFRPIGIVCDWHHNESAPPPYVLGPIVRLRSVLRRFKEPRLIVVAPEELRAFTLNADSRHDYLTLIASCEVSPAVLNRAQGCLDLSNCYGPGTPRTSLRRIKRGMDILLALVAGILLMPLFLALVLLVKVSSRGPVFYSQQRIGENGRLFAMWKFRSMVAGADLVLDGYLKANPKLKAEWDRDHKLQNDPRVTRLGGWMRKTSLDEIPQLWNVLRGEMSLVGPRPIVTAEIHKYGTRFDDLCSVAPGVTGIWQVSGRNDISYADRVELDSYYARHSSIWLDLYILAMTVKVVLFRQGAY